MVRIRRNRVLSLILAALRGFCLFISEKHTFGISAKKPARILYSALFWSALSEIYELCGLAKVEKLLLASDGSKVSEGAIHGRTGIERLLMGSVTERVIGHAETAVLVVKQRRVNAR